MEKDTTRILHVINNAALELNYKCRTEAVSFSIADIGGNILRRGTFQAIKDKRLSIETLPKGAYTLCIVDGDQLTKAGFIKSQ
jgi:hypothetical protein